MNDTAEQLGFPPPDDQPSYRALPERGERTLKEELEEAANIFGQRLEEDMAVQPISQDAAMQIADDMIWKLGRVDITAWNEEYTRPDTLELLENQLKTSADNGREAAKRKLRKSGGNVSDQERKRTYAQEIATAREAALFGERPYSAVTLHWLRRDDNAERVLKRLEELRDFRSDVPDQHRSAA